jgi:hypothetical protein
VGVDLTWFPPFFVAISLSLCLPASNAARSVIMTLSFRFVGRFISYDVFYPPIILFGTSCFLFSHSSMFQMRVQENAEKAGKYASRIASMKKASKRASKRTLTVPTGDTVFGSDDEFESDSD